MPSGTMDSQDILIWGEVRPDRYWDELKRIADACNWGKQYGLDGFVRYVYFPEKSYACAYMSGSRMEMNL